MMTNKEALIILDEVFYQGKYLLMDDPKFFEAICCAEEALKKVDEFPEVNNLSEVNNKYIENYNDGWNDGYKKGSQECKDSFNAGYDIGYRAGKEI